MFLRDSKRWEAVRNNPEFRPLLDELLEGYELYCKDKEIPVIKFSDEMDFVKTGNRSRFEDKYFLKRQQLTVYAILSMIYPEKDEYLEKLQDVICDICNEYSWQVTAHRPRTNRNKRNGLALFSCETGLYLAEIKQMLIDRLDSLVIDRITEEIDRRILRSFENEHNLWIETLKSNWAAVCGGCIGMTFMYESPERYNRSAQRINQFMENYLAGISEDGATSEGAAYWNYGFCFFTMYMDNLLRYTNGREQDFFGREKVKKLANFLPSLFLDSKTTVSFSDSGGEAEYTIWLLHYLKSKFNIIMPPKDSGRLDLKKFSSAVRAFIYYNPDYAADSIAPAKFCYEKLGWYIDRKEKYGFAIKAGNNGEEHNHNDIGSFIVASNGREIFCDLGAAEYTASNFGADRYKVFNNSSLGHSVPIVNGKEQGTGSDFYGRLAVGDTISVDMKTAYSDRTEKLLRNVKLQENSVALTDEFSNGTDIKERFVTEQKPVISENSLIIGNAEIRYDADWKPHYSSKTIKAHGGNGERTVYILDFTPTKTTDKFSLYINF